MTAHASTLVGQYLDSLYQYREYLKQSVARDLRKQYKRSVLGYLWSMLNPLLMMVILTLVFSHIMRFGVQDYAVFLLSAMLPWGLFSGIVGGSLGVIRANASIIDQVRVPRTIFPTAVTATQIVTFTLSLAPLLLVILVLGRAVPLEVLALPLMVVPLVLFSLGLGLVVAVANILFEDTQHLIGLALQALYFLCPILYGREHLPAWLVPYLLLNPLFSIIEFFRDIFYHGTLPGFAEYSIVLAVSALIFLIGLAIFRRYETRFVYYL